jgi:hypothetical protein
VIFGACLAVAFLVVYIPTMLAWRTGDAAFRPFHVFQLASFWKENAPAWQQWLAHWLPVAIATPLASLACAVVVFIGTCGVRILAVPYLLRGDRARRDPLLVGLVGAFFIMSAGMGTMMELNSYGELYLLLMMRMPTAVLAAGFLIAAWRWCVRRWTELSLRASGRWAPRVNRFLIASSGVMFLIVFITRRFRSGDYGSRDPTTFSTPRARVRGQTWRRIFSIAANLSAPKPSAPVPRTCCSITASMTVRRSRCPSAIACSRIGGSKSIGFPTTRPLRTI